MDWGQIDYYIQGVLTKNEINQQINVNKLPIPIFTVNSNHYMAIIASDDSNDQICIHNGWSASSTHGSIYCTTLTNFINDTPAGTWSKSWILTTTPYSSDPIEIKMATSLPAGAESPEIELKQAVPYIFDGAWFGFSREMSIGPYVIETDGEADEEVIFQNYSKMTFNPGFHARYGSKMKATAYLPII